MNVIMFPHILGLFTDDSGYELAHAHLHRNVLCSKEMNKKLMCSSYSVLVKGEGTKFEHRESS